MGDKYTISTFVDQTHIPSFFALSNNSSNSNNLQLALLRLQLDNYKLQRQKGNRNWVQASCNNHRGKSRHVAFKGFIISLSNDEGNVNENVEKQWIK